MEPNAMPCAHIIGTADDDYHLGLVELPMKDGKSLYEFSPFNFCPICGEDVRRYAKQITPDPECSRFGIWRNE